MGSLPDGSQNLPDGRQGNEAEGNRPGGKDYSKLAEALAMAEALVAEQLQ